MSHGVLDLPSASVEDGRLAPSGPSYAALVLNQQETLPLETARRILGHARAGLPVAVVGEAPTRTPGFAEASTRDAALQQVVADLLAEPGVRRVEAESDLAAALREAGVRPAAEPAAPADLVSVRRLEGDLEVFYLYNAGEIAVDTTVSLAAQGHTYALDAWTGEIRALAETQADGRTGVALRLRPRDTALFAVARSGSLAGIDAAAHARASESKPRTLSSWHLVVEDWQPGDSATETRKVSHEVDLDTLAPWAEIPGLEDVSGIGRYTTTLSLGPEWAQATLDLGRVVDTCRVSVNGQALPPVDPMDPRVQIGRHLEAGENTITVEVATPLGNRLRAANATIFGRRPRETYGLLGPVRLVP